MGLAPGILEKMQAAIAAGKLFDQGARILAAVSGGVDSMVLLAALHQLAKPRGWRLTAAHFNHQLRGAASDADERLVRRTARAWKIPVIVGRADVRAEARRQGSSVEMAARALRHQFLARAARQSGSGVIALAHHQDDQVELFFLRLLRGAGSDGLAGMKAKSPSPADPSIYLTRPLLNCAKEELRAFAAARKLAFSEDSTNQSLDIARNRVRERLLPFLRAEFQPNLNQTILRAMDIVGAEGEAAQNGAAEWLQNAAPPWNTLPRAVQRRALQRQLFDLGATADFDLIERLRATAEQPVAVAEGKYVVRDKDGRLRAESGPATEFSGATQLVKLRGTSGSAEFGGLVFAWEKTRGCGADFSAGLNLEQFDADKVGNSIVLRHWQAGDRFQPIGAEAPRKLQDVFTNLKTPRAERRRRVLATTAAGEIFWVQGVRIGEKFKLREQTTRRLVWRWKER